MDSNLQNILIGMSVFIVFGLYFFFWVALDIAEARKQHRVALRSKHYHHIVTGLWPVAMIVLVYILYGKASQGLAILFIALSGLLYYCSGLWDIRTEQKIRATLPGGAFRSTPASRVALFISYAEVFVGVLSISVAVTFVITALLGIFLMLQGSIRVGVWLVVLCAVGFATNKVVKNLLQGKNPENVLRRNR